MANTLSGLIPTLYSALSQVSRELIGFIPNVNIDAQASAAAVNQTVTSPVVPQNALEDITPGDNPADSGDQTFGNTQVTISKSKAYPIRWTGEEQLSITPNGVVNTVLAQQFEQGFRTLANAVEADLAALYVEASRAHGTPGTTPFAAADDLTDLSEINRILDENGAPASGRALVMDSAARAKLEGKQPHLFKVNEAGDAGAFRRNRDQNQLMRFNLGYSAGVKTHAAGTAASWLVNGTPAIGDVSIPMDTGTGTFNEGDLVTFAGDGAQYVVAATTAATPLTINATGLRLAPANNAAITAGANYTANMGFHRAAMVLAARTPAVPSGGDNADDRTVIVDPISGLAFEIALYRQYRRIKYEIGLAWGTAAPNPSWIAILAG